MLEHAPNLNKPFGNNFYVHAWCAKKIHCMCNIVCKQVFMSEFLKYVQYEHMCAHISCVYMIICFCVIVLIGIFLNSKKKTMKI